MFSWAAPYASACAWLPAEIEITPAPRSSADSAARFVSTPRGLKEPVRWRSSALSDVSAPIRFESVAELSTGVRWRRPPIASRAWSTSSSVTGTVTAMARSYERSPGPRRLTLRGERRHAPGPARRHRRSAALAAHGLLPVTARPAPSALAGGVGGWRRGGRLRELAGGADQRGEPAGPAQLPRRVRPLCDARERL